MTHPALTVTLAAALLALGCASRESIDMSATVDVSSNVVEIEVRNRTRAPIEIDDQFLQLGRDGPLAVEVSIGETAVQQCRGYDYFGPAIATSVNPGDKASLKTSVDAIIYSFCLYDPGTYALKATFRSGIHNGSSAPTSFEVTQGKIDSLTRSRR